LILLFFFICINCNVVRVIFNYPAQVGPLNIIDYDTVQKISVRSALLNLGVGILGKGDQNLITPSGYVAVDDANTWSFQSYAGGNPPAQQVAFFSHSTCLGQYFGVSTNPMGSISLDPTNMELYITYQLIPGVLNLQYDGINAHTYSFPYSNVIQSLADYNNHKLYFLPSTSSLVFYSFGLTTNVTSSINVTSPLTGGLSIDINSGKIYMGTQNGIQNYDPATGLTSNVYTNADFIFRGIAIDSQNGLLFFSAESISKMTSNLYVISITLSTGVVQGVPAALHITTPKIFVSMGLTQCPVGACGNCGVSTTSDASRSLVSILIPLFAFIFLLL